MNSKNDKRMNLLKKFNNKHASPTTTVTVNVLSNTKRIENNYLPFQTF